MARAICRSVNAFSIRISTKRSTCDNKVLVKMLLCRRQFLRNTPVDWLRVRLRFVRRVLLDLDEASATGPDMLAAKVLKTLADSLALPATLLARAIDLTSTAVARNLDKALDMPIAQTEICFQCPKLSRRALDNPAQQNHGESVGALLRSQA